jgi:putative tryptophan/tyrosine transport system substrate-binding protein
MIGLGAGMAFAAPMGLAGTLAAQPARIPKIGVLVVDAVGGEMFWRQVRDDLRRHGYIDGQTVLYEYRSDEGQLARLPELAAELVRLKVDLILTWFTPAAVAAKQATRDIPIVMGVAGDPVASGLVDTLARPGGNVTGLSGMSLDTAAKCVELSRELLPQSRRAAALINTPDPFSTAFLESLENAGKTVGVAIEPRLVDGPADLDPTFAALANARPDVVIVQPSLPTQRIAELAIATRLPAIAPSRQFAALGGLMSYAVNEANLYQLATRIVVKVLKGARPADLPVEQPTKFDLILNLRTAAAIGFAVPVSFLRRADEVIE